MTERKQIEVEADSIAEARNLLKSQVPDGLDLGYENIISNGKPKSIKANAKTIEEAFRKAQNGIPFGANILEKKVITTPRQKVIMGEGFTDQSASEQVAKQLGKTAIVENIQLKMEGKKGVLGVGKKPNQYEVKVFQQAVVKVTYKTKVKISAKIGKIFPENFDRWREDEVIRKLQTMGLSEKEAISCLTAAVISVPFLNSIVLQTLYTDHMYDTPEDFALKWAARKLWWQRQNSAFKQRFD